MVKSQRSSLKSTFFYWIFTTALLFVEMMLCSTHDEVCLWLLVYHFLLKAHQRAFSTGGIKFPSSRSRLTWSGGGDRYAVTQQHVCLQSSLHIRGGGRKIDLLSTWQHPSIISCERWKQRHWQDQTGLPSVASTLRHTWLFFCFLFFFRGR